MRGFVVGLAIFAMPAPASGEVRSASPSGFETVEVVIVNAAPKQVYAMLVQPARWWSGDHTYSGRAANLSLQPHAGGCFCETIPAENASIEHARVIHARPGKTLRLTGALGPLQAEGVTATLTWALKPVPGGTEVTQTYVVGGYVRGGADRLAPIVDQVIGEQLKRLQRAFAAR